MSTKNQLGEQPVEDRFREKMMGAASALDGLFNPGREGHDRTVGFVLLVFPFKGHEGRCNYISNGARRDEIVTLMKEQAAHFERQMKGESE
ncbi:hypothetical protein NKG99_20605 [Mesorhizobium sp. M1409]|uniref:hypothetical protein n=1 Tax=Mesorhizobium sp. M1409 TaxID=2957100 RepID=UPI003335061F